MGLIKKKTAIRGSEGGVKYVCDVCSVDITATVSSIPHFFIIISSFYAPPLSYIAKPSLTWGSGCSSSHD
jgi:hypothetical protein